MAKTIKGGKHWLILVALACGATVHGSAAIPSAERLLPEDTLIMISAPEFLKLTEYFKASPQFRLWTDPAMKPFTEKFLLRWKDEFQKPLERELDIQFTDYTSLPQGQATFAVTPNDPADKGGQRMASLLLIDTRDRSGQLRTNLAGLRKKWMDAGKALRTEQIRGFEFSVLAVSSNDVPATLHKFFPEPPQVQELGSESDSPKPAARDEWVIGQIDSMLIVSSSTKLAEKIAANLTGGSIPCLADLAAWDANQQALFHAAPLYGWINVRAVADLLARQRAGKKESDAPDPFDTPNPEKLLAATGLAGLKSIAFSLQPCNDGLLFQLFFAVPESSRQGIFKVLESASREWTAPEFVPSDAVQFQRWRIDGPRAWETLRKMLADIAPQWVSAMTSLLDAANAAAREKEPGFDLNRNLIDNLGNDLISYEKAPRGVSVAAFRSPPAMVLIGSPHPDQLAAAIKSLLGFLNQQGETPAEREFLGRKIFSAPMPNVPLPALAGSRPPPPRLLSCAASGGYVAIATDASMLEEFLRSSDNQGKSLRGTVGLAEAAQRVTGPGTWLFGFKNQIEDMRSEFELAKKHPSAITNSTLSTLTSLLDIPDPQAAFRDLMDFSLLPSFDKLARYFHFTVYAGSTSVEGMTFKYFAPTPPGLRTVD